MPSQTTFKLNNMSNKNRIDFCNNKIKRKEYSQLRIIIPT